MAFEEKFDEEYRDKAPLFCDGESLSKQSSDAEILSRNQASMSFKKVIYKAHVYLSKIVKEGGSMPLLLHVTQSLP